MTRTLYIEKDVIEDRNQLALSFPDLVKHRIYEETFTWNGEDYEFYAIDTDADEETLRSVCIEFRNAHPSAIIGYSGIVDTTKIRGVVRMGVCVGYEGEEKIGDMLETEVVDLRCQISFPLITKRHRSKKIEFIPLKLELPTTLEVVERRLKSMYVLEGGSISESEYIQNTVYLLAIATEIYPATLIWKYARIPEPITRLLNAIKRQNTFISKQKPAYWAMNGQERAYLNLDLYVGEYSVGEHFKPMKWVILPIEFEEQAYDQDELPVSDGRNLIERINTLTSPDDLGQALNEMKLLAANFLRDSSVKGQILNRREDGVRLRFSREQNEESEI